MIQHQLLHILGWVWLVFGGYWFIAASRGKSEQTSESPLYRIIRLFILALTFTLLFGRWTGIGVLGKRFVPWLSPFAYLGFFLALAGIFLALWARIHLGQYWSDKVVLKVDHRLVRTGPYAYLRHPIYSGVLLGVAGTGLLVGQWRGVLAFVILLVNYWIKAKREEQILARAFAGVFAEHKKRAGFLLPRFGGPLN